MTSTTTPSTPLGDFIHEVIIPPAATQKTKAKFRRLIRYVSSAIGRAPVVSDLNVMVLAALTHQLRAKWKLSTSYVDYIKRFFRSIWRTAAEIGLVADLPRSVYGYRYGTRRAARRRVLTHDLRTRVEQSATMRANGSTWPDIGKHFGLSSEAIRGWQKRYRDCWTLAFDAAAIEVSQKAKLRAVEIEERRRRLFLDAVATVGARQRSSDSRTVDDLLDDYLSAHDLSHESVDYYRRMVRVLYRWAQGPVPLESFTVRLVNRMLQDFQTAGKSPYYRKSIRSAMRSLLAHRDGVITGKLRPVRLNLLEPETWTAEEVTRLVNACNYMRSERKKLWWQTIIACAYYTGLSNCDLWRIRRADIDAHGIVRTRRSKTGKPVAMRIPEEWLERLTKLSRRDDPIWGLPMKKETFRQTFQRIVGKAKLKGSFKRLRKSCGTSVEMRHPGRGHIALGNTKRVFEQHYFSRREIDENPVGPEALPVA